MLCHRKFTYYCLLGILVINIFAFAGGTSLVQAQDEPDLSRLVFGFFAKDGAMIQPFTMESISPDQGIRTLPQLGGDLTDPVVQQAIYIWMAFTSGEMTRTVNYTIFEAENVTDHTGTHIEYTKEIDNGTYILTRGEFDNPYIALRRVYLGETKVVRRFALQYLDVVLDFYYQTHPAQYTQVMSQMELNSYLFLYVALTWFFTAFIANIVAKRFLDDAVWVPPPPNFVLTLVLLPIVAIVLFMLIVSALQLSLDRAIFTLQMIPALFLIAPLFCYQVFNTASAFKGPLAMHGYFEMREPTFENPFYVFNWHDVPIYKRRTREGEKNCWLHQRGGWRGYWDVILRVMHKDIEIRGNLKGALPTRNEQGYQHVDLVTAFEARSKGEYQHSWSGNKSYRLPGFIAIGCIAMALISSRIELLQEFSAIFLLFGGIAAIVALVLLLRTMAITSTPFEVYIEPLQNEEDVDLVVRIIHDRGVAKRYLHRMRLIQQQNIDLEADYYIGTVEQGKKQTRSVINQLARITTLAPGQNAEEIAQLLYWNKWDPEDLDTTPELAEEISRHLEEIKQRERKKGQQRLDEHSSQTDEEEVE